MRLNQIADLRAPKKKRKRVGRGVGSGLGKTCGAGQKGQKSRTGVAIGGFEGGQMPLYRRLPKRGFVSMAVNDTAILNLGMLQQAVEAGKIKASDSITLDYLKNAKMVAKNSSKVKILAKGELKTALTLVVDAASARAIESIKVAGGNISVVSAS